MGTFSSCNASRGNASERRSPCKRKVAAVRVKTLLAAQPKSAPVTGEKPTVSVPMGVADYKPCNTPPSTLVSPPQPRPHSKASPPKHLRENEKPFGSFFENEGVTEGPEYRSLNAAVVSTVAETPEKAPATATATKTEEGMVVTAVKDKNEGDVQRRLSSNSSSVHAQSFQNIFKHSMDWLERPNATAADYAPMDVDEFEDELHSNSHSDITLRAGARVSLNENLCTFPEMVHNVDPCPSSILLKSSSSGNSVFQGRRGVSRPSSCSINTQETLCSLGESAVLMSSNAADAVDEMGSGVTLQERRNTGEIHRIAALIERMEMRKCALLKPSMDVTQS